MLPQVQRKYLFVCYSISSYLAALIICSDAINFVTHTILIIRGMPQKYLFYHEFLEQIW